MKLPLLLCVSLLVVGCASDGSDLPADLHVIAAQPAQGTIDGKAFTLGTRYMNITDGDLYVDLLTDAVTDCTKDETSGSYPFIIFFVPAAAGTYELGNAQAVTFVSAPSTNLIVQDGVIQIDAITSTTVAGGLHVFSSEFGEINGRLDGKLCFGG